MLLSCFCFSCARHSFHNVEPKKEELLEIFIKEVTDRWDSENDPSIHNIPVTTNPYFLLKDLKIQLLGFLATKFMLDEDERGNELGMLIKQEKVKEWLVNFVKNPEDYLTISKDSSDINSIKILFQSIHKNILNILNSNDDNDAHQKMAFLILESIKSQHGLIVEKGSELAFIHSDIQKSLIITYLQTKSIDIDAQIIDIDAQIEDLGGDWPSIVKVRNERREGTILLSSLKAAKDKLLSQYPGNELVQKALNELVDSFTPLLPPDK